MPPILISTNTGLSLALLAFALIPLSSPGAPVLAARLLSPAHPTELQLYKDSPSDTNCNPLRQAEAAGVVLSNTRPRKHAGRSNAKSLEGGSLRQPLRRSDSAALDDNGLGLRPAARRALQQSGLNVDIEDFDFAAMSPPEDDTNLSRCEFLRFVEGIAEGICCVSHTWDTTGLAKCTALVQYPVDDKPVADLQEWAKSLPPTLKVLDLAGLGLTGSLPAIFGPNGSGASNLQVLYMEDNSFSGALPAEWGKLSILNSLDLSNYYNTEDGSWGGNNSFSGSLPANWSSIKSLGYFWCDGGACNGLSGSIPNSWHDLCGLRELSLNETRPGWAKSQLEGHLPWAWMYRKPTDWYEDDVPHANFSCIPDWIVVGGKVKLPDMLCLARAHPNITSTKLYIQNGGSWALIDKGGKYTQVNPSQEAEHSSREYGITLDPAGNLCLSHRRFPFIAMVYGVFGFLLLCSFIDLLWPKKASCFACLDPEMAKEAGQEGAAQQYPAVANAVPIIFAASKLIIVVVDLASDILATWAIRETSFVWVFAAMLLVPNVLAALVLHLRLCHVTCHQEEWEMLFVPDTFRMYKWLYRKGGKALLHASLVFLWPYWVLLEVPMLFAASFGRMIKRFEESKWSMRWLHLPRFCSLLSLIMACTESPFSAIVFTYFYAGGMTYQFPTLIKDWNFVLTVGTALLHMVMEFWRLVPFIKSRRFKERMRALFFGVVVAERVGAQQEAGIGTLPSDKSVVYHHPAPVPGFEGPGK
jgi:hypothetical protein